MFAGVWATDDTTVVANVNTATFAPFAKLCNGGFGSKPLQREHTILAVNPGWGNSADGVGQFWERQLRQQVRLVPLAVCYHVNSPRCCWYSVAWMAWASFESAN